MSAEHDPATPPDPDDFDRQLRELTSGQAGAAKFREPSAQERAKQAAAKPTQRRDSNRRDARKERQLRRPVGSSGGGGRAGGGSSWRRKRAARGSAGRNRPSPAMRSQRLRSAARTVGILVAFAALIVALHFLGFGPQ
jgi:hypothetical protein